MKQLSAALSAIYDAATDSSCWGEALDKSVICVNARASTLIVNSCIENPKIDVAKMSKVLRDRPEAVAFYQQHHMQNEASAWKALALAPVQTIFPDNVLYAPSVEELSCRAEYIYLRKHAGCFRKMAARLNDFDTWTDNIAFQFSESHIHISEASIKNANLLLPHVARAIELGRTFSALQSKYDAVLSALNYISVGVCLVEEGGHVFAQNNESARILSNADGIQLSKAGTLVLEESTLDSQLGVAIQLCSNPSECIGSSVNFSCAVERQSTHVPLIIEVAPVRDALGELGGHFAGSVVFVIDPDSIPEPSLQSLALAYGLTSAEAQVAVMLVRGQTYIQISEQRSVSVQTVKSQAANVLHKTRTRNKAELIRLAFRCTPPVT